MTVLNSFLHFCAREQAIFTANMRERGYETISTFYQDLTIAEVLDGEKGVRDTTARVKSSWLDNLEMFTEFVMALNAKCWEHWERKNNELGQLYADLYYEMRDMLYDHYEGNEDAIHYIYTTIE